jgi:MFS transporter, DHA1 family, inner membrane transport protein
LKSQINERLLLIILASIQFTNIVDFMIMMPMGDILQKSLQITPSQYGWLVSSYGLAAGLTSLLGVFYLDNLDRKKALLTAYLGFMLGTVSSAIVPTTSNPELNYYLFIGTRVLTGITGGLLGGLVLSIIGDVFPLERRGRAMASVTIAFSLASVIGMPLSLSLVDYFDNNWHVPFYMVSALSLPFWLLGFKFIPPLNEHLKNKTQGHSRLDAIRNIFNTPIQRSALLFTFLLVLGQFTVISFLTPYNINNVGLQQSDIKYIYLVGGACTVLSGFLIGRLVDKVGRFRVFTIFAFLSMITIVVSTNLGHVGLWVVLLNAGFFFIFITGRMIPANTITTTVVDPKNRAGFMSLNSAVMSFGSGSSAAIAGMIVYQESEHSPLQNYNIVGYIAIAATLLALVMVRRMSKASAK